MKTRRIVIMALYALLALVLLTACGGSSYADGTYTGTSSVYEGDDDGSGAGYGVATLTIQDGAITACTFETFEPDGTLKDEDYGKQNGEVANRDFYNKAQRAVQASAQYGDKLVAAGSLKDVDAISGATVSFSEFQEAVEDALNQAKQ